MAVRFWEKVDQRAGDEFWPWTASVDPTWGYGWFRVAAGESMQKAHRVAWVLIHGELAPDEQVLHRCDNPPCCRPDHLFRGTHRDNMADRSAKGRESHKRSHHGEQTPNRTLSAADVAAIRSRYERGEVLQRELAVEFGVSQTQIGRIVRGSRWNVDGATPRRTFTSRRGRRA